LGERHIVICRELTKIHEQVIRTTARDAVTLDIPPRGEFSIVIGAYSRELESKQPADERDIYGFFCRLTDKEGVSRRSALAKTGDEFGLSTNIVYALVERLKGSSSP
jgi:16S rRNA (cytidine1402-2'-O)-methyltransferase